MALGPARGCRASTEESVSVTALSVRRDPGWALGLWVKLCSGPAVLRSSGWVLFVN